MINCAAWEAIAWFTGETVGEPELVATRWLRPRPGAAHDVGS